MDGSPSVSNLWDIRGILFNQFYTDFNAVCIKVYIIRNTVHKRKLYIYLYLYLFSFILIDQFTAEDCG